MLKSIFFPKYAHKFNLPSFKKIKSTIKTHISLPGSKAKISSELSFDQVHETGFQQVLYFHVIGLNHSSMIPMYVHTTWHNVQEFFISFSFQKTVAKANKTTK